MNEWNENRFADDAARNTVTARTLNLRVSCRWVSRRYRSCVLSGFGMDQHVVCGRLRIRNATPLMVTEDGIIGCVSTLDENPNSQIAYYFFHGGYPRITPGMRMRIPGVGAAIHRCCRGCQRKIDFDGAKICNNDIAWDDSAKEFLVFTLFLHDNPDRLDELYKPINQVARRSGSSESHPIPAPRRGQC